MVTKVTKLSKYSNKLFLVLSLYFLYFIWTEFYLKNIRLSLIISLPLTLITLITFIPFKIMIDNKRETKNKLKQTKDDLILQLTVGKEDIVEQYLLNLFELNGYKKLSDNHYVENNSEIIFSFSTETMDQDTINSLIRKRTTDRLYIFCIKQNIKYLASFTPSSLRNRYILFLLL